MSTSTLTLNIVGALAIGALALYVLLPGMQDALYGPQAPYLMIRPSATLAGQFVIETHATTPVHEGGAVRNAYGLDERNPVARQVSACARAAGIPAHTPSLLESCLPHHIRP
jgi:hypothetical protein